jgi:hypothetical protein
MARRWALCWACALLVAGEACAAAPPTPAEPRQVRIDLVVARAKRGEFAMGMLDAAGLRDVERRLGQGVRGGRVQESARPRLVTRSGNEASFFAGGERPVEYRDAAGRSGVRYEEVGTRVNVLPTMCRDGKIHLEAEAEISHIVPKTSFRHACRIHTSREMRSGEGYLIVLVVPGETKEEERDLVVLVTAEEVTNTTGP